VTQGTSADVVVIGGGCMGTSIAWQLARRLAGRVVLVEKTGLASGGTGRSSALVRQHYTFEPLARMALHSLHVFEHFASIVGGHSGFRRTGFLVLLREGDRAAVTANVDMQRSVGIDARVVSPADISVLEPRLSLEGVGVGAWEPSSGYADPHGTTMAYAAAAAGVGVSFVVGTTVEEILIGPRGVTGVKTSEGVIATEAVVVAAGFATRGLLLPHGVDIPIRPVRHAISIVQRSPTFGPAHPIVSDRILGSYYRPEADALTLIGTTSPLEGTDDPEVEVDRLPAYEETTRLAERYLRRFPADTSGMLRRGYSGVYDCSPDFQPMLGRVGAVPGLHVAVGFSGHGFKLSPAVGELLAEEIVLGRTSLVDIRVFSPDRFAVNKPISIAHPYSVATL
jgi:sarcosine oxidase, subunit beta